jgi:hypothetical protein
MFGTKDGGRSLIAAGHFVNKNAANFSYCISAKRDNSVFSVPAFCEEVIGECAKKYTECCTKKKTIHEFLFGLFFGYTLVDLLMHLWRLP